MKWIRFCGTFVVLVGLTTTAQAGLFSKISSFGGGDSKCCASNSNCQPKGCKPVIKRPCEFSCHTFQRKVCAKPRPCCKPTCCNKKKSISNCCKRIKLRLGFGKSCCDKKTDCCTTKKTDCKKATNCCPTKKTDCCSKKKWYNFRLFKRSKCCDTGKSCCDSKATNAAKGCCPTKNSSCNKQKCCNADPCEIAELIYDSQTACYAKDRRKALSKLGGFDCQCNPEIMVAFVYGLNDADETVRAEAADEIGDQLRGNSCCCSKELTAALTVALADCDKTVRRQAEEALEACGYEVVDGCCDKPGKCCKNSGKKSCCKNSKGSDPCCTDSGKAAPTPTPRKKTDKAPPAPGKGDIYYNTPIPSRKGFSPNWESSSSQKTERSRRLSNLFGLLN